jgi:predicted transcriptional regulator
MLGPREQDIVHLLWTRGGATVAEVREGLEAELAYTTVLTILRNLEAKGVVRREEEGRAHRYFPVVEREEARESAVKRLLDRFFGGNPESLLTHLVDAQRLSEDELEALQRRIEEERGRSQADGA